MRSLRLAILPLLVATSLAAQAPAPTDTSARLARVSPRRTAFFDVAALVDSRQRFGLEPLVFGRWALGLVGTHSRTSTPAQAIAYANPLADPIPTTLCPVQGCPPIYPGSASSYNAWSLDLAVRYYPAALSFNDPRRRFMVYVGEFIGYHQRTLQQPVYPPLQFQVLVPPSGQTIRISGWEPGAEIGMRMIPLDPIFIDVGGWFKLVTIDDPMQRIRPGQLDSRLVVAVGIGW